MLALAPIGAALQQRAAEDDRLPEEVRRGGHNHRARPAR